MIQVSPSVLSANFCKLGTAIEMLNESQADMIHIDVMDGVFVPNISFGFPVMKDIAREAVKPLDVHMMIVDPGRYVNVVRDCGASIMGVHYEACTHLDRVVHAIKEAGMKASVTLNPATPVELLEDILYDVDMVLLMAVNPGFGGQKFIKNTINKLCRLKKMMERLGVNVPIEIDGGVNYETGRELVDAGADILVAGNYVFSSPSPSETIARLKEL